jgi:hypothetical protein
MPTNLTASAGDAEVTLDWAATTASDLNHYNVYRDGTQIASPTNSAYIDSGLRNGTTYTYQVTAVDDAGNESVKSASASATPRSSSSTSDPVITAAGDICGSPRDCRATSDLNLEINPTKMLTLGDNAYNDGSLTQYMTFYDPNWGRFKANTKPVTGNHEFHIPNAQGFHDYFGAIAPDQYYSYDIGSWHFVALASSAGISPSAGGAEETWLRADLAAHPNQCPVAYWREPSPHPAPGEAPSATDTAALPERPSPPGRASRWPFSPSGASALSEGRAARPCSVGAAAAAALCGDRLLLRLPRGPGHLLRLRLLLRGPLRL